VSARAAGQVFFARTVLFALTATLALSAADARAETRFVTVCDDGWTGTLRRAIADAAPGDTIQFLGGGTCVISLSLGELILEKDLTIQRADMTEFGAGPEYVIIHAPYRTRVFRIAANANVTIDGLWIVGGEAGAPDFKGGGIYNGGTLTLRNSVVWRNTALDAGGGIYSLGALLISHSSIVENFSTAGAGVISSGPVYISNSTISANGSLGGGLIALGSATARSSTIVGNAGVGISIGEPSTLVNTVVAGNTGEEGNPLDVVGTLLSGSHNLIGDPESAGGLTHGVDGNVVGVSNLDAVLDPLLALNGGRTLTHALVHGSAAIDAGNGALAVDVDGTPLTTDQRGPGFGRAAGVAVDIGAFEVQSPSVGTACPLGVGYWKHAVTWPVPALTLGDQSYARAELLTLLNLARVGDASVILAVQLIAARLNVAQSVDDSPIAAALAYADELLTAPGARLPYGTMPSSARGTQMVDVAESLEAFNRGALTVGCRE
jgi:hypothetical protein